MENIGKENQLDQRIKFWNDRENQLKELFKNPNLGNQDFLLKEKLKYFEGIRNQAKNSIGDDKITRNVLKGTIRQIEKQLYPNWYHRQFQRLRRNVERAIEKFIDQRRFVPQSNIFKSESTLNQKNSNNNLKISDDGAKQNLKNGATQEIKQKEQETQKMNADPLKNSAPDRHNIATGPLRNRNVEGMKKDISKLKDETLPKKQLRHRLH